MRLARALAGAALAAVATTSATACTSGGHPSAPSSSGSGHATRFWSEGAQPAGSVIDVTHPTAAAAALKPDRAAYCRILSSTLTSGHDVLKGTSAGDPALAATTAAWLAEVTAVAPATLTTDWQTVGAAVLALVARSEPAVAPTATAVASASTAIAADAKSSCSLELGTVS